MYDNNENIINMVAAVKCLVFYLLFNVCSFSPTTELLERVKRLLNDCAGFYSHADLNMAENLIVCLEVAVDSVQCGLVDSLDRDTQANAGRIPPLESLVRQLQHLLHRWEMLALRAVSCTSVRPESFNTWIKYSNCHSFLAQQLSA